MQLALILYVRHMFLTRTILHFELIYPLDKCKTLAGGSIFRTTCLVKHSRELNPF